jgi:CRISPR-associated Csx2 family protein
MTHTLVTFLGRTARDQGGAYRTATYEFPNQTRDTTSFFGLALARHLKPDRIVVLGTRGSMWGALVEHVAVEGDEAQARLDLIDAEAAETVDQPLLDRVTGVLRLGAGCEVAARVIPFGRNEDEQHTILETIAAVVGEGEVSFDLTHGFRHLGMVGMLSAVMLERIGRLTTRSLWYGALDMTDCATGITPVLPLDALNAIQRWIAALDRFDASGDYAVFAPLLVADGVPRDKARCLEEAAFYERTFNLSAAARKLRTFRAAMNSPLPGASGLFQDRLSERLKWVAEKDLAAQQRTLAQQYLGRADFVRAATFAWEAVVTRECKGHDFNDRIAREAAQKALDEKFKARDADASHARAFRTIRSLRNAVAHGTPPEDDRVCALLGSPETLREGLRQAIECLLP